MKTPFGSVLFRAVANFLKCACLLATAACLCSCASIGRSTNVFCYPQSEKPVPIALQTSWNYYGEIGINTYHGVYPSKNDPKELVVVIEDRCGRKLMHERRSFHEEGFFNATVDWSNFRSILFHIEMRNYEKKERTEFTMRAELDPASNLFRWKPTASPKKVSRMNEVLGPIHPTPTTLAR